MRQHTGCLCRSRRKWRTRRSRGEPHCSEHIADEHGLTLTQTELYEIVRIAREVELEEAG